MRAMQNRKANKMGCMYNLLGDTQESKFYNQMRFCASLIHENKSPRLFFHAYSK